MNNNRLAQTLLDTKLTTTTGTPLKVSNSDINKAFDLSLILKKDSNVLITFELLSANIIVYDVNWKKLFEDVINFDLSE